MNPQVVDLLAGSAAGLATDVAMHPVDTVRTRLWVQGTDGRHGYKYRGVRCAVVSMVEKEGVLSLYKGVGVVTALSGVGSGLYFATYEFVKRIGSDCGFSSTDPRVHCLGGLMSNVTGALAWTPMDVIKQRQQAAVGQPFKNVFHGLISIHKEGGLRNGVFRGFWAGVATYGPFSAIYFMAYEKWKVALASLQNVPVDMLGAREHLAGGFVAGALAAVATAPIDLVKTRQQVGEKGGFARVAVKVVKEEGIRVFTKGMGARLLWLTPGSALTIAGYEHFRRWIVGIDLA